MKIVNANPFAALTQLDSDEKYARKFVKACCSVVCELECVPRGDRRPQMRKRARVECFMSKKGRKLLRVVRREIKKAMKCKNKKQRRRRLEKAMEKHKKVMTDFPQSLACFARPLERTVPRGANSRRHCPACSNLCDERPVFKTPTAEIVET